MTEPAEMEPVEQLEEKLEEKEEKLEEKPKKQRKEAEDPPEEITLQTAHGPVIFSKKKPVGRPKKEAKAKAKAKEAKPMAKKVTIEEPPVEPPAAEVDKENAPPPPPPEPPLVRMSAKERLEEHMKTMFMLKGDQKESQRNKYRAMLRA